GLEPADLEVPAVPLAEANPQVVGIEGPGGTAHDVGGAGRLAQITDQLDLSLNEDAVAGVCGRHPQDPASLLVPERRVRELRVAAHNLLAAAVQPGRTGDADPGPGHVRPLQPMERRLQ